MRFLPTYEKGIGKENHNQCQQKATPNHILIPTTPFNKGADVTTHILQKKGRERKRTLIYVILSLLILGVAEG